MEFSAGNPIVDEVGKIAISGNIIPQIWYKTITKSEEDKRPYLLAVSILADIVYWYRPTEIRDEYTGQITGIKKKFKGDMLQRSYKSLCELYGENEKAIQRALLRLEKLGVIKRVFKTVDTGTAMLGNVMFLELLTEGLLALTFPPQQEDTPMDMGVHRGGQMCPEGMDSHVHRGGHICPDITNININTIITKSSSTECEEQHDLITQDDDDKADIKKQIGYKVLFDAFTDAESRELLDEIVKLMYKLQKMPDDADMQINGTLISAEMIKKKLKKITYQNIDELMSYLFKSNKHISNKNNYLLSVLYNAPEATKSSGSSNKFNQFSQNNYDFTALEKELISN